LASIVSSLDQHQGAATAVLTAVLVAVTVYYAVQNKRMVGEMQQSRELAERAHEAEAHRERLRDLRSLTDDAACALHDLWSVLGAFAYAMPRGNPPVSRRSPTEARDPDPDKFVDVFERLRDTHIRITNRVEWGDTLHSPVGAAVVDAQAAFNAIVYEDPYEPRGRESANAIHKAIGSAQHGLRDLQATARQRFAPLGLPDSRYAATMTLTVRRRGPRADALLAALRTDPARHAKVVGPDKSGRVVIRDEEREPGEARRRLEAALDAAGDDWADHLELAARSEVDLRKWENRRRPMS
jgi:hypothetical protein